ncbi:hypothetical protein, partial [Corynebacterium kefirresidentii]|uniref:hypothetical protein n=1 Tax=Corynebacterium kefirresidentii TaxID=1979527 RepID=UPI003736F658
ISVGPVEMPFLGYAQLLVPLTCLLRGLAPQIGHLEAVVLLLGKIGGLGELMNFLRFIKGFIVAI